MASWQLITMIVQTIETRSCQIKSSGCKHDKNIGREGERDYEEQKLKLSPSQNFVH